MFLYSVNLFPVRRVSNFWLFVWTGDWKYCVSPRRDKQPTDEQLKDEQPQESDIFDSCLIQESALVEEFLEGLPQFIVQTTNNLYVGGWSINAILSTMFSLFGITKGVWEVCYKKLILKKTLLTMEVKVRLPFIGELLKLPGVFAKDLTDTTSYSKLPSIELTNFEKKLVDIDQRTEKQGKDIEELFSVLHELRTVSGSDLERRAVAKKIKPIPRTVPLKKYKALAEADEFSDGDGDDEATATENGALH